MNVIIKISVVMILLPFLSFFSLLSAQEPSSRILPIKKIAPGVFRLGEIQIHKGARSATFPAQVNMDKGLLEYLLVQSGGKTHESLLITDVDPYYLNIAFLLLGFEGTDSPLAEQGVADTPKGEAVEINIIYREGDRNRKVLAETWIEKSIGEKKESPSMMWIYTGSKVMQGTFLAQAEGSVVAVYHDPAALIDNAAPGGESDEIWFVREDVVPSAGTPVTVVIKAK
jgi:hypothetical protein